jgi:hypothetical protein
MLKLFALKGSVQQLLDKKNDMDNQDDVCTVLGELKAVHLIDQSSVKQIQISASLNFNRLNFNLDVMGRTNSG